MRIAAMTRAGRALVVATTVAVAALPSLGTAGAATAGAYPGHWSVPADLATARYLHAAVALPDGRVLVAGGYRSAAPNVFEVTASAEVVDPASGTTAAVAPMSARRTAFAATALPDGRVLAAGGRTLDTPNRTAELFDPSTLTWQPIADVPFPNATMAAPMGDGRVLVVGGWESQAAAAFNPAAQTWTPLSLPSALTSNNNVVRAVVGLSDGSVLAMSADGPTAVYRSSANEWTATGSIEPRQTAVDVRLLDGRVLVAGGSYGSYYRKATAVFNPATRTWAPGPPLAHSHSGGVGAVLPNGDVLVAGGYAPETGVVGSAEILVIDDFSAGWQSAGAMQFPRRNAAAVTAGNGSVVVTGGQGEQYAVAAVEVFANSDQTPPTIAGAPDRSPDVNGWYTEPVTVRFTCADSQSGVASCAAPVLLGDEGRDQSATGAGVDRAGNRATTTVSGIDIDFTAPTTTVDTPYASVVARPATPGAITGTATDAVSGVLAVRVLLWSQVDGIVHREIIVSPTQCTEHDLHCRWSVAIPDDLPPGAYDVTVNAIDYASHVDPFGAATRLVLLR